ncbi:MAG: prolyl oligopeptidase family serine peptidase, partial [Acidimicrobiia bacterium]|nr:prolyl oligopeptidase family serine peptidase [Acidimicrobiia bacterium]
SFADIGASLQAGRSLPDIDPSRLVVAGHSAGGTMALWVTGEEPEVRPDLAVSVAGMTDLVRAEEEDLGHGVITGLVGRRESSTRDISPLHRLPTGIPTMLISCLADTLVGASHAREFATAAGRLGDRSDLLEIPADHMAVLDPTDPASTLVVDAIAAGGV